MSSFAALMALSKTQTDVSDAAAKNVLDERNRKKAAQAKAKEQRERKEREDEARMRAQQLEDEKREQERQRRLEQEREARERERERREQEERERLLHGPRRAPARDGRGYPAAARRPRGSEDDDEAGANALTREEKRKRRLEAELRYGLGSGRRAAHGGGYTKAGRRLPGGAVDITTTNASLSDPSGSMSVRQRLAAEPAMLIKLNVNKRDTRTIDEILQDRARAKSQVLQGDQAKEFSDWFGKSKGKETAVKKEASQASQTDSASTSRAHTPAATTQTTSKAISGSASPAARTPSVSKPSTGALPSKAINASQRPSATKAAPTKGAASGKAPNPASRSQSVSATSKPGVSSNKPTIKKRPRSPSLSDSPEPTPKKRSSAANDISSEIWKLFGKDRSRYVANDVYSDDEDMEAGARDLEREELRSARIARKEEELALEEERRHEEEKRRRRKEKEMREKKA
ncbi:hypothetical protein WOLCODRAFT_137828 [Wolfiporia cocos MD-104 SS10]|uniref:SPT2-domain-containing protein n=1 Tax=Wolfiporia cocos (strain MD-104) TaxID=742152 RepID=A0A2H3JJD4_WOLCO|nr:hypothetical protein WOLCODRAFT_137828 [Wolfiporia cocos MD-104 SS10]